MYKYSRRDVIYVPCWWYWHIHLCSNFLSASKSNSKNENINNTVPVKMGNMIKRFQALVVFKSIP